MFALNCGFAFFLGANPHRLFDIRDEDFAIADFSGLGGLHDRRDRAVQLAVANDDFQFDLRKEIDRVFAPR